MFWHTLTGQIAKKLEQAEQAVEINNKK